MSKAVINSWATSKRLFGYLKSFGLIFTIAILGNLVYAGMDYALVKSIEPLTDEALVKGNMKFLAMAPFFIVGVIVIRGLSAFISAYCMSWVGQNVVRKIRVEMVEHFMMLPSNFFDKNPSGKLISKITYDTQQVASAITDAITKLLREGGLIGYILFYLFTTSWKLAVLFLFAAPIIGVVVALTGRRFKNISKNIQLAMGGITQKTQEMVEGYKVIKIFGGIDFELKKFEKEAKANFRQNVKMVTTQALSVALIQLIAGIFLAIVLYVASQELANGALSPGQFVTMLSMMILMLKPLKIISNLNSVFQRGLAAADSIFSVLDELKETDESKKALSQISGKVEFKNVVFSYDDKKGNIINNISFTIESGKTVALVGQSGSGKSTITNLLLRLHDHNEGQILIDDIEINSVSLKSLRENTSLVSQDVILFDTSIAKNIAYACESKIDPLKLKNAAIQAHAWEFIKELPNQFDEEIGERGSRLSGGQRQRIAIARALYKDSPIVILDEATSALDTESERHIQKAFESLTNEKTTLVIAHRLSTIENADEILVLKKGEIVERGNHQYLMAKDGYYKRLYQMQFKEQTADE